MPLILFFWFLFGPLATRLLGYTPGRRFGFGADLPQGVFWQWRRWCLTRWFEGRDMPVPDWYRVTAKMKFVAVSDDIALPPKVVWRGMRNYPAASKHQLTLRPDAFGLTRIGHIGAFARSNSVLWPEIMKCEAPAPVRAAQGLD